jgi:hypothetical protein
MASNTATLRIDWGDKQKWLRAAHNTKWCLVGCAAGDFATILFFQVTGIAWSTWSIMILAMINGLLTSILLETVILSKQMALKAAFKTAIGMSMISMLTMELAMNVVDIWLTGGAKLTWWVIPVMLLAGFLAPLPYNYWRLKALNKCCH